MKCAYCNREMHVEEGDFSQEAPMDLLYRFVMQVKKNDYQDIRENIIAP